MQRWEYLTLTIYHKSWSDSAGRKGDLERPGDVAPLLNKLGEQGWDLAGVLGSSYDSEAWLCNFRLFLKRPRD